jgi:F-type H+-transporting ATPase subunit epsilon
MNFHIDVVSLKGKIYSGEAKEAILPTIDGEITVLANHAALVTPLDLGEVVLSTSEGVKNYSIGKGIFEINDNKANLLIEDVTSSDEISEARAQEAHRKAEELIKKGIPDIEAKTANYTYRKSLIDLKVARRKRKLHLSQH